MKTTKERHRGGQEPPDEVHDRPEQNAGYDRVVSGQTPARPTETRDEGQIDDLPDGSDLTVRQMPPEFAEPGVSQDADDRAEREAAAEVRRRERRGR